MMDDHELTIACVPSVQSWAARGCGAESQAEKTR